LISETVLEPKLATMAAPVASLMATPTGLVPTVTAATGCVLVRRFTIEALPLPLLAQTARPDADSRRRLRSGPTAIVCRMLPKVGFGLDHTATVIVGLMSMVETLLQPLLVTTAIGENGPLASWSAMATELGMAGPLVQATFMFTVLTTRKSVGLTENRRLDIQRIVDAARKGTNAGIVAVILRPLASTCTFPAGIAVPSKRLARQR